MSRKFRGASTHGAEATTQGEGVCATEDRPLFHQCDGIRFPEASWATLTLRRCDAIKDAGTVELVAYRGNFSWRFGLGAVSAMELLSVLQPSAHNRFSDAPPPELLGRLVSLLLACLSRLSPNQGTRLSLERADEFWAIHVAASSSTLLTLCAAELDPFIDVFGISVALSRSADGLSVSISNGDPGARSQPTPALALGTL